MDDAMEPQRSWLPAAELLRQQTSAAHDRVRKALWPGVQAAAGAGLAWWTAHDVLGHRSPFFAPIAAAVSLSLSPVQRFRRAMQLIAGVLVGIAVAEPLSAALGTSGLSISLTVLATAAVVLALGGGFLGDGMMFGNQALASAVIVVALHRTGTGPERALDAIVGGAWAAVIGVGLFPVHPLKLLHDAERSVLGALGATVTELGSLLADGRIAAMGWTLGVAHDIHTRLAVLDSARVTARRTVRIAPRRMRLGAAVTAECARVAQVDLLANSVLSMMRAATSALDEHAPVAALSADVGALGETIGSLAMTSQPWPRELVLDVAHRLGTLVAAVEPQIPDRGPIIASVARRTATDLLAVLAGPGDQAAGR